VHPQGRNDPCACGSGRKFKRCCGAGNTPAEVTDADRALGYDVLDRIAQSRRFADDFARVAPLLVDDQSDLPGPLDDPDDELATGRVVDWFCFDVPLPKGGTIADHALGAHAAELTPAARRLIAELRDAPLRLLQVRTVYFGTVVLCVDVLEPQFRYRVAAPGLGAERHDLIIARIVNRGAMYEIEGDAFVLPPDGKRKFARDLARVRRMAERRHAPPPVVRMIQGACLLRLATVFERLLGEDLYTAEGDPVQPAAAVFAVRDRDAVLASLAGAHDVVRHCEGVSPDAAFVVMAGNAERAYALAVGLFEGDTLRVDAFSPQRAERARRRIMELAGPHLTFDRIDVEAAR
jgi:hypothetical protein